MRITKVFSSFLLATTVYGTSVAAQNLYADMATGIAQEGLSQADAMIALVPFALQKNLGIAIEGYEFETAEFCLGNVQTVVNMGAVISNLMPFSEVATFEDNRGPVGMLRLMLNGHKTHIEIFCEEATLKALELPWGSGNEVPQKFENTSLSALLGTGLNLKLQGFFDNEINIADDKVNSLGDITDAPISNSSASDDLTFSNGIATALADALNNIPSSPPLTDFERESFIQAVNYCWNVDPGSQAARVTVTVAFNLDQAGRIQGDVRQVASDGGTSGSQSIAFQAARRAILRCGAAGYDLPVDKYDQWKEIEATFEPLGIRLR